MFKQPSILSGLALMHISQLDLMARFINDGGDPCDCGCDESDVPDLIEIVILKFLGKLYRVVEDGHGVTLRRKSPWLRYFRRTGFYRPSFFQTNKLRDIYLSKTLPTLFSKRPKTMSFKARRMG